jgi:hypothetical protein
MRACEELKRDGGDLLSRQDLDAVLASLRLVARAEAQRRRDETGYRIDNYPAQGTSQPN